MAVGYRGQFDDEGPREVDWRSLDPATPRRLTAAITGRRGALLASSRRPVARSFAARSAPAGACYLSLMAPGYREHGGGQGAREVAFWSLRPATRERLIAAFEGRGAPSLASSRGAFLGSYRLWGGLSIAGAVGLAHELAAHFGSLSLGLTHADASARFWASASLACLLLGGAFALRRRAATRGLPFAPGVHVFARELVDASTATLRLLPMTLLREALWRPGEVTLFFRDGERYRLAHDGLSQADLAREAEALREALELAEERGDAITIDRLDPFTDEREGWGAAAGAAPLPASTRVLPAWAACVVSVAAALALSGPLVMARNHLSDGAGIARAEARGDDHALQRYAERRGQLAARADESRLNIAMNGKGTAGLERYLAQGGHRRDLADEALYKRAIEPGPDGAPSNHRLARYLAVGTRHSDEVDALLFARAEADSSTDTMQIYAHSHGAKAAFARDVLLPLREIEGARERRSVRALRHYTRGGRDERVVARAREALDGVYDENIADLRDIERQTPMVEALIALVAHARVVGPDVLVRGPRAAANAAETDDAMARRLERNDELRVALGRAMLQLLTPGILELKVSHDDEDERLVPRIDYVLRSDGRHGAVERHVAEVTFVLDDTRRPIVVHVPFTSGNDEYGAVGRRPFHIEVEAHIGHALGAELFGP